MLVNPNEDYLPIKDVIIPCYYPFYKLFIDWNGDILAALMIGVEQWFSEI